MEVDALRARQLAADVLLQGGHETVRLLQQQSLGNLDVQVDRQLVAVLVNREIVDREIAARGQTPYGARGIGPAPDGLDVDDGVGARQLGADSLLDAVRDLM